MVAVASLLAIIGVRESRRLFVRPVSLVFDVPMGFRGLIEMREDTTLESDVPSKSGGPPHFRVGISRVVRVRHISDFMPLRAEALYPDGTIVHTAEPEDEHPAPHKLAVFGVALEEHDGGGGGNIGRYSYWFLIDDGSGYERVHQRSATPGMPAASHSSP